MDPLTARRAAELPSCPDCRLWASQSSTADLSSDDNLPSSRVSLLFLSYLLSLASSVPRISGARVDRDVLSIDDAAMPPLLQLTRAMTDLSNL